MRRTLVIVGTLLVAILLVLEACAPASTPSPTPTPPSTPAPTPAEFEVMSLDIKPMEVVIGETVSIIAEVKNTGGSEGTYAAILTVDGAAIETKKITIIPGSSKRVTFSLVKETPGTYEIGMGELSSSLSVIRKEIELKYDDGTSDESWAIGGVGRGYVVDFSPPAAPFTISEVKIYGSLYGTRYEKLQAQIEVWDKDFNILYSCLEPHTKFSTEPGWVGIATPDIVVDGDFYIFVCTSSPKEGGIQIYYDSSAINTHSEVTDARHITDWHLETPKDKVNWMIRVVGSETTTPSSTEEQPPVKEVELKYDDGIDAHGVSTSGRRWGYSVHFSPPTIPFTITEVKVLTRLRTGYLHDKPYVEIWDKDFKILYSREKRATLFHPEVEWASFNIPNIIVDGDFRVVFFQDAGNVKEGGVGICNDLSGNKGSEVARSGGKITEWLEFWENPGPWGKPEARTNWMIRVVGICSGDVTPVIPPPPEPTETTPEFQEAISLLDNPEKLSQWMTENLNYDLQWRGWLTSKGRPSPEMLLGHKGASSHFAMFACAALEHHGYETEILSIAVQSFPSKGHTLCVYHHAGSLYTINVCQIKGPYETYEEIAFDHHKDWSRYSLYYSWGNYQKWGYPDEVFYRE